MKWKRLLTYLLFCFVLFCCRKDPKQETGLARTNAAGVWLPQRRRQRMVYLCLFAWVCYAESHLETPPETDVIIVLGAQVKPDGTPSVQLEELGDSAIVLLVRGWTESANYWPVLYDVNEKIYEQLPQQGLNFPFPQLDVHIGSLPNA